MLMDILSAIIIGSIIIGVGFSIGLGVQGYFMYKCIMGMAIMKSAPNVEAAIRMAKNMKLTPKEKTTMRKNIPAFSADNMPSRALDKIRAQQ
jgi:hypothetical protein